MNEDTRKEFDCALTLRQSSPGLSQEKVVAIVSMQVIGDEDYINPNSIVGLVIYQAYLGGIEAAGQFSKVSFAGIDMTEGYEMGHWWVWIVLLIFVLINRRPK